MSERSSSSSPSPSPSPSKSRNPRSPTQRFNAHFSFMGRKSSALKQAIVFSAFFILLLYAFVNTFFSPATSAASSVAEQQQQFLFYRENFLPFHEKVTGSYAGAPKVRVFMYDLPKQFTTGIIEQHSLARGSKDMSKATYPGHQHMGEWYMYSDLKRPESERVGSPIVRVNKPEEADLFYVPVFSSLSLIVNTGNPALAGPDSAHKYSDESMQEQLVDWLEKQKYWKRYNGRDHVIVASDPNALYRIIDRVQNAVLLLSDFGRVRPDQGSLMKDVIVPYSHRINTYQGEIGVENRNTLLFFMGNRYRKDGGKVRDLLFQMLEKEKDVIIKHGTQSRESRRAATHGMHTSKFCLNPAGDTPSACRLFDSIVSLCVPIIVSDSIELPFEDVIDYKKFTIFIETKTALKPKHLVKLLRAMPAKRILEYQKQMLRVRRYFEYDDPNGTVNEIWREIAQKLPLIQLMINRDKRLVRRELSEPDCSCLCTNMTGPITSF